MNKKGVLIYLFLFLFLLQNANAQSSQSGFFGLLGDVFEDLVAPGSIISKLLSVPIAGDETVFKLALWIVLFVIFFHTGTRTIFTEPNQRKIAGFIAAFIALIGAWFFNFSQLQNIGVIYATLILFALYLGPILAVFYLMYGGWGERGRNPFEEPTTLNFALKTLFSGILLWLIGTLAKEVGIGSFSGYRRDVLVNVLGGQSWLTDITAYIFTILFLMFVYYLIRFILSLIGNISGGDYSEGEARFGRGTARAGRAAGGGAAAFFRGMGEGLSRRFGRRPPRRGGQGGGEAARVAEEETRQEMVGIRETEAELEDVPILLQRLRNPRNNQEINESARRIMEIVLSSGRRERQYIERITPQIETALRALRLFSERITRENVVEELRHISEHNRFRSYPEDLRNTILTAIRDLPELMQQISQIDDFLVGRIGRNNSICARLISQLQEIPPSVEDALRRADYAEVEANINTIHEILQTLRNVLREVDSSTRDLQNLINRVRIIEDVLNTINTRIGEQEQNERTQHENMSQEENQFRAYIQSVRDRLQTNRNIPRNDYNRIVALVNQMESNLNQGRMDLAREAMMQIRSTRI